MENEDWDLSVVGTIGSGVSGFAELEASAMIHPSSKFDLSINLLHIVAELSELLNQIELVSLAAEFRLSCHRSRKRHMESHG